MNIVYTCGKTEVSRTRVKPTTATGPVVDKSTGNRYSIIFPPTNGGLRQNDHVGEERKHAVHARVRALCVPRKHPGSLLLDTTVSLCGSKSSAGYTVYSHAAPWVPVRSALGDRRPILDSNMLERRQGYRGFKPHCLTFITDATTMSAHTHLDFFRRLQRINRLNGFHGPVG